MSQFVLSRQAQIDMQMIWNYLAINASFDVADRVASDIENAIAKVAELPVLGHTRADVSDTSIRFYRVHSYLIAFVANSSPLQVVHILHGARNIRQHFLDA